MTIRMESMAPRPRGSRRRPEAGYNVIELITVVAILGIVMLVTIPNLTRWYETYRVRTNARGVAAFLKVARMKAVADNVSQVVDFDSPVASACPNFGPGESTIVAYRDLGTPAAEQCYSTERGIAVEFPATVPVKQVSFRTNGMARNTAPNWFLVRGRRSCQLVCVNAVGAVRVNRVMNPCVSPYQAPGGPNPCPTPP